MTVTVVPDCRGLIVPTLNPAPLLQSIPNSFQLDATHVGCPHDLNSVITLARFGIDAPSPIAHYYRWPRDKTRYPTVLAHQRATAAFATMNPRGYILNDIGTAKTASALWAADWLIEQGIVRRVLVVAPLSTLDPVWGEALFVHFTHRKFRVLHGSAVRRKKLLAEQADFYISNPDGIATIQRELAARTDIDLIIVDEVAAYRNSRTSRWKALNTVIYPIKGRPVSFVWGMTGAPRPNHATDAYGQCKLVTPSTVPRFFTQFRSMVQEHHSQYVWVDRPEANKIIYDAMRPAIRFKRSECVDLPPTLYQTRDVTLSADQVKHYKEVAKELYTEIDGHKITAINEGIKLSKLLQIAGGVVYDTTGAPHEIDTGSRLETLMEVIEEAGGKVLVFVPFTAMTTMIAREVSKYWETAIITGDTPVKERTAVFQRFEDESSSLEVIVAHPGTMSHGLTLIQSSVVCWWTAINSNDTYLQACGRITRPGQKRTTCVINLSGSAVERKAFKQLQERGNAQGVLLSMVEGKEELM